MQAETEIIAAGGMNANFMSERKETVAPVFAELTTGHFREGRSYVNWRARGTSDWLLIYTVSGSGTVQYAGGGLYTRAGIVTLFRPHTPQDYCTAAEAGQWELLWAHFHPRPPWREWLDWPEAAPGLLTLQIVESETQRQVEASLGRANELAQGAQPRRDAFAMNALETALLWCDTENPRSGLARLDSRVRRAMDYVCLRYADPITLETLAAHSNLSVSRLAHLFRREVGMTVGQFVERQRLNRARQLLELTSRTVQSIAGEVGFENAFYFTNRFKRDTGLSPRDYRRRGEKTAAPTGEEGERRE